MFHYLNVCDIKGDAVAPVDIITFGSPCQDLSVAGKRAGLKHSNKGDDETTRSGLFIEAVRIIKEMRNATNGKYPRFALWENVPGAFSSNGGEDFRVVLEELAKIADETVSVPVPPKGKWTTAGYLDGDGWSIAWRTVDAQYHGVPQRRRRILLVADFAGQCAGEISFKCEGLRGYPSESGEAGQAAPADAARSPGGDDPRRLVIAIDNHPNDSRINIDESGNVQTLTSRMGTGGGNVPLVMQSAGFDGYNATLTGDKSSTLGINCGMSTGRNGVLTPAVADSQRKVYALQGGGVTSQGAQGSGVKEDVCFTINTLDRHAVAYGIDHAITTGGNCTAQGPCVYEDIEGTLKASGVHAVAYGIGEPIGFYPQMKAESMTPMVGKQPCLVNGTCPGFQNGVIQPVPFACNQRDEVRSLGDKAGALQAQPGMKQQTFIAEPAMFENHSQDTRYRGPLSVAQTVSATYGMGGNNQPFVVEPVAMSDKADALLTEDGPNGVHSQRMANPENNFVLEPIAYGIDRAAFNQGENAKYDFSILPEQQPTMTARGPGATCTHYIVRRLTPTECARLQGFPDWWGHISKKDDMTDEEVDFWNAVYITHQKVVNGKDVEPKTKQQLLTWYNKLWTDGAEYKMWGNGVALPCVRVPIHNMAKLGAKTLASLFDGSGGFPLAGVLEGIDPLWCSEIEPYPIAVTRERFPELTEEDLDRILEEADI